MSKITFYGATGTVTGSRHFLELDDYKFLIDCGMFQGRKEIREKNWDPFPVPANQIDRVFLTHAHIDHSGFLPRLVKEGFRGQVHSTHSTSELVKIMLLDSAHLHEEDAKWANKKGYSKHSPALPLYTTEDAEQTLTLLQPKYYGEDFYIDEDTRVKFKDAGHILGSSFIEFKTRHNSEAKKILFSGDIGRPERPILQDPTQVFNIDYLVLESTYGQRLHEPGNPTEELSRIINESIDRGGVLVIPAFAVGRTQTLLYVIRQLEEEGKIPALQIYVDSPMAIRTTDVFEHHPAEFDLVTRTEIMEGKNVLHPQHLNICRSREESIAINSVKKNAIIISASGMLTGGRILHHMEERLPNPKNTVLLVGYQAEGTRGRTLMEGHETVKIHGEQIPVKAKVESMSGYSGHADYNEILAWLSGFNRPPLQTFIVHGEPESSESMAQKIRDKFGWNVTVPQFGQSFDLDM